jgi:hypothetical protein
MNEVCPVCRALRELETKKRIIPASQMKKGASTSYKMKAASDVRILALD